MAATASRQRIPELDGIRGFAMLMVLTFHYVLREGPVPSGTVAAHLQRFLTLGWTGLDFFFVLSGFLIGGILMEAKNSPSYFKTFYTRRFFRIIPIYYLWILLYIVLIGLMGDTVARYSNSGIRPPLGFAVFSYFLFLQNFLPPTLFGIAGSWFGPLWSLAVEEQFYLVAPLAVRAMSGRALRRFLLVVIVGVPLIRIFLLKVWQVPSFGVTTLVVSRADALGIGMLAASLTRGENPVFSVEDSLKFLRALLGVLFLGVAVFWKFSWQSSAFEMQSVGYTWMALFYGTILLLAVGHPRGWIAGFFRFRLFREVGIVSYCIYLTHVAVNVVMHSLLLHHAPKASTPESAMVTALAALVTFGIARMSWQFIEKPLQRLGHAFKY
jgi:peptidoglycan/LPS O-acetylase OafA/YrhL